MTWRRRLALRGLLALPLVVAGMWMAGRLAGAVSAAVIGSLVP